MPGDPERLQAHRDFFARLITASIGYGTAGGPLATAFAATPRERFVGPGPWRVFTAGGYITTPSDDPAFLYQDVTVALRESDQINNGQPMLHAAGLAALQPESGQKAVHIGAGTGYYTALLASLVGPGGSVAAFEIDEELARRAKQNLADLARVTVHSRSGASGPIPECDVLYVSAGATAPLPQWLDALRPGGRLLFPLTPAEINGRPAPGAMLLVTKRAADRLGARFLFPAAFIACIGARDDAMASRLTESFRRGNHAQVKSLRRSGTPDASCWVAGDGWWLSTDA